MGEPGKEVFRSAWWRYGTAIVCCLGFLFLKLWTRKYLGDTVPFVLFFTAVMISAFVGGLGPGLLATALSTIFAAHYFMDRVASKTFLGEAVPLVTFAAEGFSITVLTNSRRRVLRERTMVLQHEYAARQSAEQAQKQLNEALENITREMTHRKQSEESLRASEERRQRALDSAELGEWHLDPTTMAFTTDTRFRAIFGVSGDDLDYEQVMEIIHPDDIARVQEAVAATCWTNENETCAVEYRVIHPDHSIHWVLAKGRANVVKTGPDQTIVSFDGTVADISQRKEAESFATTILESITDAFFAVDRQWRFTYVNKQAERLLGRMPGDLIGKTLWEEYPGLLGAEFEPAFRRAAADGAAGMVTSFYPDHERWYEIHVYPALSGISVYFRDVTEQKQAEEQQQRAAAEAVAAAEANAKFRTFFEQGIQFAGVMTLDGTFIEANKLCLEATGFRREEVIGKKFWDCGWWNRSPELMELVRNGSMQAAAGKRFSTETKYFIADGSERIVELTISPVTDGNGRVLFIAPTGIDITEKKRLADERERLLDAERAARSDAERASRLKDEFLATLSHELRTPLNAILGWSQILRRRSRQDEEVSNGLAIIERNSRVQAQLIEDLLDMSRIISGKLRIDVQRVELAEVVNAAIEAVRPAADAKEIPLQKVLDTHMPPFRGDPARLQQVVWNLLSNAVKFTPKGGKVQVTLQRVNSHVEITVADTGAGIKPEFLPYVFDRFRQADSSTTRRYGGLGLGLAIVKNLVELHGGKVYARSPGEGKGSTFVIELPLSVVHVPDNDRGREHPRHVDSTSAREPICDHDALVGVSVLVVDDEEDARNLIARVLQECKATVNVASSAEAAIELLQRERPMVLLSDIGMPGEDGYEFIRRVRLLPAVNGGSTPAAALTAFARSEDRTRALRAGYQSHVAKPVEPSELVTVVASLAGKISPVAVVPPS